MQNWFGRFCPLQFSRVVVNSYTILHRHFVGQLLFVVFQNPLLLLLLRVVFG